MTLKDINGHGGHIICIFKVLNFSNKKFLKISATWSFRINQFEKDREDIDQVGRMFGGCFEQDHAVVQVRRDFELIESGFDADNPRYENKLWTSGTLDTQWKEFIVLKIAYIKRILYSCQQTIIFSSADRKHTGRILIASFEMLGACWEKVNSVTDCNEHQT